MNKPRLIKSSIVDHEYEVYLYESGQGDRHIGTVSRTGSLPSCQRWHAYKPDGAATGATSRTRAAAVFILTSGQPS